MALRSSLVERALTTATLLGVLLVTTGWPQCGADFPSALRATSPEEAPTVYGAPIVGVTATGEGRAKIFLSDIGNHQQFGDGVVGDVALLSADGGATWLRRPSQRYSHDGAMLIVDALEAGRTYEVQVAAVSNLGILSAARTTTDDSGGALRIAVPASRTDTTPPAWSVAADSVPRVQWQRDGVGLEWNNADRDPDTYGYHVNRAEGVPAGSFQRLTSEVVLETGGEEGIFPTYRDASAVSGQTYVYRVVPEDLSGNPGAPGAPSTAITVP